MSFKNGKSKCREKASGSMCAIKHCRNYSSNKSLSFLISQVFFVVFLWYYLVLINSLIAYNLFDSLPSAPNEDEIRKSWVKLYKSFARVNWKTSRVCSAHFISTDYEGDGELEPFPLGFVLWTTKLCLLSVDCR